jgi:uncharacterized protein YjlB
MSQASSKPARRVEPATWLFVDDGLVPNNATLPFVVYRAAIDASQERDPAALFEHVFARNDWADSWRNGIYPFVHFHSMCHEVLGMARGRARVQFGGPHGQELDLRAGDVAVLPAGTGHQCREASPDLVVVGAYPPQGTFDLCRATREDAARARERIPEVPRPQKDPLYGADGPLMTLWGR